MEGELAKSAFQRYVADGGPLMGVLIPCSVLAVAYIIRGLINLRGRAIMPPGVIARLRQARPAELENAVNEAARETPCVLTRLLARTLERVREGRYHDEDTLAELIAEEIAVLYQRNSQLAVIYTISPLIGLLGTVLGMMNTFFQFSEARDPSVALLAIGFNQALITTMWGLCIAVPSYVFLAVFRNRLFRFEQDYLPAAVQELLEPVFEGKQ